MKALLLPLLMLLAVPAAAQGRTALAQLERRAGGRLGVMALDTGTGRSLAHRADERFLLCSTFKLPLVVQVLQRVDAGAESLDRILPFGPADLLDHAPAARAHVQEGGMRIEALCEAAIVQSDNTAANLLLASLGGPEAYTRALRAQGDAVTRLDRYEPALNRPAPGKALDTTTPRAMVATLRRQLLGDVLSAASRQRLEAWLLAGTIGAGRLKAGLPPGWRIAHKTGSGAHGATNDIGILYPPTGAPILVAAYYTGSTAGQEARDRVLAEAARLVAETLGQAEPSNRPTAATR